MKYFYLNIFLVIILIFVFFRVDYSNVFSSTTSIQITVPTTIPTPTPALPIRLIIPKLVINSQIEPVNVATNNIVEVPNDWNKTGWYSKTVKPGEVGTAMIVGHYDNQLGSPAIFYYLNQLEKEDKIIVLTNDSRELIFTVKEKTILPFWSSIDDLMVNNKNKNLILITCAGWWNQALRSYSERLVIRAVNK